MFIDGVRPINNFADGVMLQIACWRPGNNSSEPTDWPPTCSSASNTFGQRKERRTPLDSVSVGQRWWHLRMLSESDRCHCEHATKQPGSLKKGPGYYNHPSTLCAGRFVISTAAVRYKGTSACREVLVCASEGGGTWWSSDSLTS